MAKNTHYVVWKGRDVGIFDSWTKCLDQVKGFSGAKYQGFSSLNEAEVAWCGGSFKDGRAQSGETNNEPDHTKYDFVIYTDGASKGNPGPSGCGIVVFKGNEIVCKEYGGYAHSGTNNTSELLALIRGLQLASSTSLGASIMVVSDSQYGIKVLTEWGYKWSSNGWKKSDKKPVENLNLVKCLWSLNLSLDLDFMHVNGHVGIAGNELADELANKAVHTKQVDFIETH